MNNLLSTQRDKMNARGILLNLIAQKRKVIYGARAINEQLPYSLRKETGDYDIYTKKPRQIAEELVEKLNKEYRRELFVVIPAKYHKTFKVKDIETGETFADFTGTTKKPESINVMGVRYAKLNYHEKKIKKTLKDMSSAFRHEKDIETLQRIKQSKKKLI